MTRKQREKTQPGLTAEGMVTYLNELFAIDPEAMRKLVLTRVPCNEDMCNHPTVMVSGRKPHLGKTILAAEREKPHLGILGVINGLFHDGKVICAVMSQDEKIMSGFKVLDTHEIG